jgi:prepilin-type N-terminal cleavage/methylation domain-containing protein
MSTHRGVAAAAPQHRPADGGFTLTELLVAIVLFAIVGGAITMATTSGLHHQREVQARGAALAQARTALQRVDRDIRSAAPLAAASRTQLVMLETGSGTTTKVCYLVQATSATTAELVQTSVASSSSCPSAATSASTILLTNLVNTSTTPVFSFAPTTTYAAPSDGSVTATTCAFTSAALAGSYDPSCVGTVTVQISVQPSSLSQPVTVSDNGTELRNAS